MVSNTPMSQNGSVSSRPVSGRSLDDMISKAKAELKVVEEQLTLLETRRAELKEAMNAAETVKRYLTVAP